MARNNNLKTQVINCFSLMVSGLALGWLVGLSVSPVIQVILTSIVAIIVSLSGALAGISRNDTTDDEPNKRWIQLRLDPLPIMCMMMGLALGASAGVYARTNYWLGARTNQYAREWADTGYSKADITRRVFDNLYPPVTTGTQPLTPAKPSDTDIASQSNQNTSGDKKEGAKKDNAPSGLAEQISAPGLNTAVSAEECRSLRKAMDGTEDELRREMALSKNQILKDLSQNCPNQDCLKNGVKKACKNP